jgi:hypothetical protein
MRIPCVRFTVRRMMIVVAVAAMLLGLRAKFARRHELARYYEIRALRLDRCAASLKTYADMSEERWIAHRGAVDETNHKGGFLCGWYLPPGPEPALTRRFADYNHLLAMKYHRAARQPWWPVETDSPPPKP